MSREPKISGTTKIKPETSGEGIRYSMTFRCVSKQCLKSAVIVGDSNTNLYKFGNEPGTFGGSTPRKRVKAGVIGEPNPFTNNLSSYSNIVIQCGIHDIRYNPVSQDRMQQLKQYA